MNFTAAWHALGYLCLVLDTILAVAMTMVLCCGELDDLLQVAVWFLSVAIAVFFWAGLLL